MSLKEHNKITEFINGTIPDNERKELSVQLQSQKSKLKHNKNRKMEQFNADKAWDNLHSRIKKNKIPVKNNVRMLSSFRIAASIALLIGISVFGYFMINDFGATKYSETTSGNEIKELVLPDGSKVSLNINSSIKYPNEFIKDKRSVEFTGEAFFDITKNPDKPFVIKSNDSKIIVLGTSFNVEAKDKSDISVTVKTGKVKLAINKKEHVFLTVGEVGTIKNNTISKRDNADKNFLSWKTKCFEYNGEKLEKVIADFNKVYNVNIIIDNDSIGDLSIVSKINDKPLDVALDLVCATNGLKNIKIENKIVISNQ